MSNRTGLSLLLAALVLPLTACPGRHVRRGYPEPRADEIVAHLRQLRERARTLRAETLSDARIGDERANVTVLMLAAWGGRLRFMAMNPNESMAADLASDGGTYCFLDANANCGDCGPATPENVARLIRIPLEPDDVVATLLGGTPLLAFTRASVRWQDDGGREILTLVDDAGRQQTIVLDGRGRRWDVLDSTLRGPDGALVWRIRHKEFHEVARPGGAGAQRLPGKSFFEQPGDSVLIRWRKQELDVELDPAKFRLQVPDGLPACGRPAP